MLIGSLNQNFVTNPLVIKTNNPKPKFTNSFFIVSCKFPPSDSNQNDADSSNFRKVEKQLARLAVVTLVAGALTLSSISDASAAKSGGRVGGQAFRSSAPRPSSPRPNSRSSRTNIYVNPPIAPPLGGYGYGYGSPFYGGWGWSPFSFFAPGPGVAVGVGGGFDPFVAFIILGAVAAVLRRFRGPRRDDDDDY